MPIEIVFETHSSSDDNERGIATGWLPGRLSLRGRGQAEQLGRRRRNDGLVAVFTSDLRRAIETAELAFANSGLPIFADWRLRECNYGQLNGASAHEVHAARPCTCENRILKERAGNRLSNGQVAQLTT